MTFHVARSFFPPDSPEPVSGSFVYSTSNRSSFVRNRNDVPAGCNRSSASSSSSPPAGGLPSFISAPHGHVGNPSSIHVCVTRHTYPHSQHITLSSRVVCFVRL